MAEHSRRGRRRSLAYARPSTSWISAKKDVDARDKRGHDVERLAFRHYSDFMNSAAIAKTKRREVPAPPLAPRCCSPGTTAIAACCRGGRRRASGPIRTGSGCRKSCCSRPASKPSGRISRNFWRAGRMSRRSAAPRSTTCCGCGPGSAIIRGRAICTPARWRCCAIMAGCFRTPRRAARAAGDRAVHGGGDRGDRVRPPHHAGRRQYRARGVAAVRGRGAAAAGQAADPAIGGDAAGRLAPATRSLAPATARRR